MEAGGRGKKGRERGMKKWRDGERKEKGGKGKEGRQ